MRKHQIAFVIHGLCMGGAEKFLIELMNHFCLLETYPLLITLSHDNVLYPSLDNRVEVVKIIRNSKFDFSISFKIKELLNRRGITKVVCINTYSFFLTKLALVFSNHIQLFLSLHSTIPPSKKAFWQNIFYFRMVQSKDALIFLCHNQQAYLNKTFYIRSSKQFVFNNGIDPHFFSPQHFKETDQMEIRKGLGFNQHDKLILVVARLHPEKGHKNAFQALSILHRQFDCKAHLLVVGGGDPIFKQELKTMVEKLNLTDYVHFMGVHKDIRQFYHIADVFTLSSWGTETFSLAALEAMAFGLPCSLTNIGGANEMIIDGVHGKLTIPKNSISIANSWHEILNNHYNKEVIRKHVLKNFQSSQMLHQYQQLILPELN
jgi:glycosyltransferase involved in cell wall biosynthesis